KESKRAAQPVPVPQLVKNHLIALCKDVAFTVRCSLCHKVLISHQAAQAHFNVQCRHGCAVVKADKTIVEFMKQLCVCGQCCLCSEIFLCHAEIERHKESLQHDVEVTQSMAKALLLYCRFTEIQRRTKEAQGKRMSYGLKTPFQMNNKRSESGRSSAKRQKLSPCVNASSSKNSFVWFCECGLQFSEEAPATNHLLAANQIFYQCGVCGKHMGESSITRLHMSRIHGGAHLSSFLFFCRKCRVEMPRYEDIMSHVSEVHRGHTYVTEKEVPSDLMSALDAKPSTSNKVDLVSVSKAQRNTMGTSSSNVDHTWMCRMCEDIFDSEAEVRKHCSDVNSHNFQRFVCGHCPQKFFKESTVRRHCMNEHGGEIKSSYFCGLCDSMQFESEGEFMEHYRSLHSKDYCCMNDAEVVQTSAAEGTAQLTCSCMGSEESKDEMKATYTRCMRNLSAEGRCQYVCAPCCVSVQSYAQMKTHIHTKHAALNLDKTFEVECNECPESFTGVPSFHKHYHSQHCVLEPCVSSRISRKDSSTEPSTVKIINALEIKPAHEEIEDEKLVKFLKDYPDNSEKEACGDESDDEMRRALSLSAEEARELTEMEEALTRSPV
ncbi:E3 SUMO-protein ligase ZNF451, partial [Nematolebias whitei]|uniref:E3 SUMO-protein ligase ZNF451 n=1 Tax=Nematolebias whitei TaxID=451745 RepID=UPI0018997ACA